MLRCMITITFKDKSGIFSPTPISTVGLFINENHLHVLWDRVCKRTIINFISEFKKFKKDTKKQLYEFMEKDEGEETLK